MATTIKLKNGSGAPTAGDLVQGEPALDLTNKRLYTEDSGGTVIEVGTNPGTDVTFADNRKAIFGAGSDLQIYHDGSNSYIDDAGTGNLFVRADSLQLRRADGSQLYLAANTGAEVGLYHAGNAKLATTSTGIDVTGTVTADGLTVEGATLLGNGTNSTHLTLTGTANRGLTISTTNTGGQNDSGAIYDAQDTAGGGVGSHEFRVGGESKLLIAADGDISFYEDTGTTAKLFWDASAESLGIGTTSPLGKLAVEDSGTGSEIVLSRVGAVAGLYGRVGWTGANGLDIGVDNGNVLSASHITMSVDGSEKMRIDASGNVGIGTTNPVYKLVVSNGGASGIEFGPAYSGTSNLIQHYNRSGAAYVDAVNVAAQHRFSIGASEAMRIDSSGNLLVGNTVTNPASNYSNQRGFAYINSTGKVEIATTANDVVMDIGKNNANDGSLVAFRKQGTIVGSIGVDSGDNLYIGGSAASHGGLYFGTRVAAPIDAGTLTDAVMDLGTAGYRFKDLYLSGNATVGSSTNYVLTDGTNVKLTLKNTANTSGFDIGLLGGASDDDGFVYNRNAGSNLIFGTANAEQARIDSSGNLLVGTTDASGTTGSGIKLTNPTSPADDGKLMIVGASTTIAQDGIQMYSTGASAYRFFVQYSGQINATSTSINAISDVSLKENIRDLDKGLETILALQPRRFDWKNGDGNDIMGFVAQEVETVLPELVHDYKYNDEETKLGLKMGDMIPSLVKAIQEQNEIINDLRARVAQLEGAN